MQITGEGIALLIVIVVVVMALLSLVKNGVKIAVSLVLILVVFRVGFMATGTDLNQIFHIDKVFKPESADKIIDFFDEFREKGDDIAIMDSDSVYNEIVEGIQKGASVTGEVVSEIDVKGFSKRLIERINKSDLSQINIVELKELIIKTFPKADDSEIEAITENIISQINKPLQQN